MALSAKEKERLYKRYGKWVVVTGATSGIGRELALLLASAKLSLVLVGRNEEKLRELKSFVENDLGVEIRLIAADLSTSDGVDQVIAETADLNVGMLVASAGFGTSGSFLENPLSEEIKMLRVNCEAVLAVTHAFGKRFAEQGRGGIVLLSSLVAFQGVPYASNYAATKAYVQSLAEGIAVELRRFGVDVLAAAPGPVRSGFEKRADMKMGTALEPSEVAGPILHALGRSSTVLPGTLSKILVTALRTVPRWAKVKIMAQIMRGFTRHQQSSSR